MLPSLNCGAVLCCAVWWSRKEREAADAMERVKKAAEERQVDKELRRGVANLSVSAKKPPVPCVASKSAPTSDTGRKGGRGPTKARPSAVVTGSNGTQHDSSQRSAAVQGKDTHARSSRDTNGRVRAACLRTHASICADFGLIRGWLACWLVCRVWLRRRLWVLWRHPVVWRAGVLLSAIAP